MNKKLGTETTITPEELPFSYEVEERNNKVLYEALIRTMEDAKQRSGDSFSIGSFSTYLCYQPSKKNSQKVLDAKERELNSLKDSNVFNWAEDYGEDSVSCKWVLTE